MGWLYSIVVGWRWSLIVGPRRAYPLMPSSCLWRVKVSNHLLWYECPKGDALHESLVIATLPKTCKRAFVVCDVEVPPPTKAI